ncbi:MAG: hypothetical protein IJP92_16870 [Lachnospiraceae bacterium]|nr:hypothetical protein [Lachnospiraceae bacterium]
MNTVEKTMPESWQLRRVREDGGEKKLMVYQVTIAFLLENKEEALKKIRDNLALMRENAEKILLVFSPHENCDQMERIDPELYEKFQAIVAEYKEQGFGIYDEEHVSEKLPECFDAYYGDASVLAHYCRNAKVPVMIEAVI